MRKFIFTMIMALFMTFSANAQIATENAKVLDNTYVSVEVGAATPLNLKPIFPLNTVAGVHVGKWFTPVWGAEVEGSFWFGSHSKDGRFGLNSNGNHNFLRGHYVGVNGLVNLTNLFAGYKGAPRTFEVSTVLGTGWIHEYIPNETSRNGMGVKTGLDLAFNLGKAKAHTISIRPAVLWDINAPGKNSYLTFNKNNAQLYLGVAYTYHFRTSNGTRYFKTYDVGEMKGEIARLNAELAKKPKEVIVEKTVTKETIVNVTDAYVFFAFDSAELDDRAKEELDKLGQNGVYVIDAYASNEGSTEYNKALSQRRADAVKAYLEGRGAKVDSATGHGVQFGTTTGRTAVVTSK